MAASLDLGSETLKGQLQRPPGSVPESVALAGAAPMLLLPSSALALAALAETVLPAAAAPSCPANVTMGLGLGATQNPPVACPTYAECCTKCTADPGCIARTWLAVGTSGDDPTCAIRHTLNGRHAVHHPGDTKKVSGYMTGRGPQPPPPPLPPPPPAPAGSQKNIVFLTNDDQDQMLGSMRAMPHTARLLGEGGANLTQFRVNTPICCPSRSTMLTGKYEHNNRMRSLKDGGCMHMNSSREVNPAFWLQSHPVRLHKMGYTTGFFGKVLNGMNSYGCDGTSGLPPGLDRQLTMCTHVFFNCSVNFEFITYSSFSHETGSALSLIQY